jgi:hypothetical protein
MNLRNLALATLLLAMPATPSLARHAQTYAERHATEPPIPAGMGRIYFYREDGFFGSALHPTVMLNGVSAGDSSRPGEYFYVDRPPGDYTVSASTETKESTQFHLTAGKAMYVNFEVSMGVLLWRIVPHALEEVNVTNIADCEWDEPDPTLAAPPPPATPAPTAPAPATPAAPATPPASAAPPAATDPKN